MPTERNPVAPSSNIFSLAVSTSVGCRATPVAPFGGEYAMALGGVVSTVSVRVLESPDAPQEFVCRTDITCVPSGMNPEVIVE